MKLQRLAQRGGREDSEPANHTLRTLRVGAATPLGSLIPSKGSHARLICSHCWDLSLPLNLGIRPPTSQLTLAQGPRLLLLSLWLSAPCPSMPYRIPYSQKTHSRPRTLESAPAYREPVSCLGNFCR